jgi:lipoate---protein ligase
MLCLISQDTDPYLNLAAEEYLFKNREEPLLFLYSNLPSVVVGKHQNTLAEIDYQFVKANSIKVVRRITGGGAVYHDEGNLNFSFHQPIENPAQIEYKEFITPVVEVLRRLGFSAEINSRNDILIGGKKVSGHAAHVFRNRIMSHGTLLVNSDKEWLSKALNGKKESFAGKGIASVKSKVANLTEFIPDFTIKEFLDMLCLSFSVRNDFRKVEGFLAHEREQIEMLAKEKYRTWAWNFAYSPSYSFSTRLAWNTDAFLDLTFKVEKGVITIVTIANDHLEEKQKEFLTQCLLGHKHNESLLTFQAEQWDWEMQNLSFGKEQFLEALF